MNIVHIFQKKDQIYPFKNRSKMLIQTEAVEFMNIHYIYSYEYKYKYQEKKYLTGHLFHYKKE